MVESACVEAGFTPQIRTGNWHVTVVAEPVAEATVSDGSSDNVGGYEHVGSRDGGEQATSGHRQEIWSSAHTSVVARRPRRTVVTTLRDLDGPDLHTPVVMAVRGPKAQAVAAEVADTVAFALMPGEDRVEITRVVRDFRVRAIRDVELAQQVAVIGDTVAPHLAIPDTDPAALRAADSLEVLPEDPAAAAEEIQRRREEIGFSYFVFGARHADVLAPVVAELAGR